MNFFKIINNLFKITEIKHQANIINYLKKIKLFYCKVYKIGRQYKFYPYLYASVMWPNG